MNIAFLVPYKGLSGGLKVITTYANSFLRKGHIVTIFYPNKKTIGFRKILKGIIKDFFLKSKDHLDFFHGTLIAKDKIISEDIQAFDAVIATGWETAEVLGELNISNKKKFYFIQGFETWGGQIERVLATYKLPIQKIVISTWLQKEIEFISGEKYIPIISNGKDFIISDFHGDGINRPFDIGLMASNVNVKRFDIALDALNRVRRIFPDCKIVIIAPHKLDLPLPKNTKFFLSPTQNKIKETYLSTKVWISSSEQEGFCLPALEAISLGTAVVATDSKGVNDIIQSGQNGFIVPCNDAIALSQKVVELLNSNTLRSKISHKALIDSANFNWEKSSTSFLKILESDPLVAGVN